jgi:hypothetical protein
MVAKIRFLCRLSKRGVVVIDDSITHTGRSPARACARDSVPHFTRPLARDSVPCVLCLARTGLRPVCTMPCSRGTPSRVYYALLAWNSVPCVLCLARVELRPVCTMPCSRGTPSRVYYAVVSDDNARSARAGLRPCVLCCRL